MDPQPLLHSTLVVVLLTGACTVDGATDPEDRTDGKADGGSSARLGARPTSNGVEFRVWAPNADRVFVTGTFNGWNDTANELSRGDSGVFAGRVADGAAGDEYLYVIERGSQRVQRADPRAEQMTNSAGHSVIYDQSAYRWQAHDYRTPSFDEAVVYEMHIGTFNDQPGDAPGTWTSAIARLDHLREYRDLIALRKNAASQTRGLRGEHVNVFHVNETNKVIAFHRWDRGGAGDVIVILNFSNQAFPSYDLGMPRGGVWKVRFNGDWKGYDGGFAGTPSNDTIAVGGAVDGLGYHAAIGIGAYSAVVLSQ